MQRSSSIIYLIIGWSCKCDCCIVVQVGEEWSSGDEGGKKSSSSWISWWWWRECLLTVWRTLLPYGYSYLASCARPG